ncbi:MAG: alpha/beta hydrolase [Dissulfuribacterales bacterium]
MIPGLGFAPEIFQGFSLKSQIVYAPDAPRENLLNELKELIKSTQGCHVLGWSLGGLLALELKRQLPELVHKLILIAIRRHFDTMEIREQIRATKTDFQNYLRRLYKKCFVGQMQQYAWFKNTFEQDFLNRIRPEEVQWGLHYLASNPVILVNIKGEELLLFHGEKDLIAPPDLMPKIPPKAQAVTLPTGHLPFLHTDFTGIANEFLKKTP